MKTRIKNAPIVLLFLITISLALVACSSYKGGKIKDGVYTNDIYGFKITPDSDMKYLQDPIESDDYAVAFSYCYLQGGKDSFLAEYALDNPRGGLMVVSEDNVGGYDADGFVESIENQLKDKLFFTYRTQTNENVTIGNTTFRKYVIDSEGNHQTFLIKTTESRIIFIYIAVTKNGVKDGLEDKYLNAISGI